MDTKRDERQARRARSWRLVATVWLTYALFATTNVARETYLSLALAERGTIRVDEYLGLHPDLFEIPGRGAYINNNPGASFLGAFPYLVARPLLDVLYRWKPALLAPKPPATYDDPRPNRTKFLTLSRARGLDVKLGIAALVTAVGLMAPLGALAAWLLFTFLRHRGVDDRAASGWALLYAMGTPLLFRSAFLNQNALLTHLVLGTYIVIAGLRPRHAGPVPRHALLLAGLLMGYGLVCDYSAAPLVLAFGAWLLWLHRQGGWGSLVAAGTWYTIGVLPMIALVFWYQQAAFGSPWFPAQRYMPATEYSVVGWNGFSLPTGTLLRANLFDVRFGLLAFCPLLLLGVFAPAVTGDRSDPPRSDRWWFLIVGAALLVFSSANQFANLQWNTGVRYMVPLTPLLFLATRPVWRMLPRAFSWGLIALSVLVSLAVSMWREDVVESLRLLFTSGPTLPVLTTLQRMASAYPALQTGEALPALAVIGYLVALALLWRRDLRPATT